MWRICSSPQPFSGILLTHLLKPSLMGWRLCYGAALFLTSVNFVQPSQDRVNCTYKGNHPSQEEPVVDKIRVESGRNSVAFDSFNVKSSGHIHVWGRGLGVSSQFLFSVIRDLLWWKRWIVGGVGGGSESGGAAGGVGWGFYFLFLFCIFLSIKFS